MILIPSLIDESIDRSTIVETFAKPNAANQFGIVSLVPSVNGSGDWKGYGATVANRNTIADEVAKLRRGEFEKPLVIVNRYDGIDLPDETCRVLIVDSKPYSECLFDTYLESCLSESNVSAVRVARTIEQGLGRSVRGEKDYCAIILIGADLVRAVRTRELRQHLSSQTSAQIELGLEIAEMSREDIQKGSSPMDVLFQIMNQCLQRDDGWKQFYKQRMDAVNVSPNKSQLLEILAAELEAEKLYRAGDFDGAVNCIQGLIDRTPFDDLDRGWYMQVMARYLHSTSKTKSNEMQVESHKKNTYLLKPMNGMEVKTLGSINQKRVEKVIGWLGQFESFEELVVTMDGILDRLSFGVQAEKFERSLNELATVLGLESQRPDKEWGEGPDNLWSVRGGEYLLFECKSEASINRSEITKREADQMNRSVAWFQKYYDGASVTNIMIIPTHVMSSAGNFLGPVTIMTDKLLKKLKSNVKKFIHEFRDYDLRALAEEKVQQLIGNHHLDAEDLASMYSRKVNNKRRSG